jgi:tRNA threonylcarbamoyladenosine biosynthesis protein TsaE
MLAPLSSLYYHLHDEAATLALGAALSHVLVPGLVIYLQGDLGAGKTTLTRSILHHSGYSGHVKSPTYSLAEMYPIQIQGKESLLVHFDLYRLNDPYEFIEAGLNEEFNNFTIGIIEWPQKAQDLLPLPDIHIQFNFISNERDVELHAHSEKGILCLNQLRFSPNI